MLETHGVVIANQAGVTPQQVEAVRSLLHQAFNGELARDNGQ